MEFGLPKLYWCAIAVWVDLGLPEFFWGSGKMLEIAIYRDVYFFEEIMTRIVSRYYSNIWH